MRILLHAAAETTFNSIENITLNPMFIGSIGVSEIWLLTYQMLKFWIQFRSIFCHRSRWSIPWHLLLDFIFILFHRGCEVCNNCDIVIKDNFFLKWYQWHYVTKISTNVLSFFFPDKKYSTQTLNNVAPMTCKLTGEKVK